tara:strand:+ start:598 stop:885 length:288 start_codon:yes stop_codon:yes gene_type:complete
MERDTRRLSEDDGDFPAGVIVGFVFLGLFLLFCCCVCFVVRCFSPENKKGPAWVHNTMGKRWVRPFAWNSGKSWLAYEEEESPDLPCPGANRARV